MKPLPRRRVTLAYSFLLLLTLPVSARGVEQPLFSVGEKIYTLKDLIGVTEEQLRQRFQAVIKDMSDENLLPYMTDGDREEVRKAPAPLRRTKMEEFAFRSHQGAMLRQAIELIIVAGITENILRDQGIDAADYFDLQLLHTSMRKETRYVDILYTDPDQPDKDDALLEKLNETLGIHYAKARWRETRESVRRLGPLRRLHAEFCRRSTHYEDIAVKAILAHALLEQACAKGAYQRKAWDVALIDESIFTTYEIDGYSGDKAILENYFRSITKDGFILERGVEQLLVSLRKTSTAVVIRAAIRPGWDILNMHLPIGVLTEPEPGRYRIVGWRTRYDPEHLNATGKKSFDLTVKKHAYDLAALDYYPDVHLYSKRVPHIRPSVISSLWNDGLLIVGAEMHRGKYVKKPYPAQLFDTCREAKSKRETFAVRAALAVAAKDKETARQLVAQLTAESKKPAPETIQERFRAMAEQLAKEFKLDRPAP